MIDSCVLCSRLFWNSNKILCVSCIGTLEKLPLIYRMISHLGIVSLFHYLDPARRLILLGKRGQEKKLTAFLSLQLTEKFNQHTYENYRGIISVPSRYPLLRDHAWVMAVSISQILKIPIFEGYLVPIVGERASSLEHKQSLSQSLIRRAKPRFQRGPRWNLNFIKDQRPLLIVDDVVTSGVTLLQCWSVLGRPKATALTLASTPRFHDPEIATDRAFKEDDQVELRDEF